MAEIESRVQALQKDTQGRVPSLQEMEDRLAILQGRTPPSTTTKPVFIVMFPLMLSIKTDQS